MVHSISTPPASVVLTYLGIALLHNFRNISTTGVDALSRLPWALLSSTTPVDVRRTDLDSQLDQVCTPLTPKLCSIRVSKLIEQAQTLIGLRSFVVHQSLLLSHLLVPR